MAESRARTLANLANTNALSVDFENEWIYMVDSEVCMWKIHLISWKSDKE